MEQDVQKKLREYIGTHNISQKIVALNTGIKEQKLSRILHGNRKMSIDDYILICYGMGVHPRLFFSSEDQKQ